MEKEFNHQLIIESGLIAIVRFDSSDDLVEVAKALVSGGVKVMEFTFTTPNAIDVLKKSKDLLGNQVLIGAGTVLDSETARAAILAGADFIVSPIYEPGIINLCRRYSKISMPGVFTPTEIVKAWQDGADFVKVFPSNFGGPDYIKALKAPLPNVAMVPVGGVNLENIPDYFSVGASAVAVGSNLVRKDYVLEKKFNKITELASKYIDTIKHSR